MSACAHAVLAQDYRKSKDYIQSTQACTVAGRQTVSLDLTVSSRQLISQHLSKSAALLYCNNDPRDAFQCISVCYAA